jgi:hypothetical protein
MKKTLMIAILLFLAGCVSPIKQHPVEYSSTGNMTTYSPSAQVGTYLEFSAGQFIEKK